MQWWLPLLLLSVSVAAEAEVVVLACDLSLQLAPSVVEWRVECGEMGVHHRVVLCSSFLYC